ncbi:MAG TPA: hypothetical protein VHM91_05145, partial [Verrucomicrobiales bacterium]|nr:hypothetical protein [Verrucomicrobiales bacterium]
AGLLIFVGSTARQNGALLFLRPPRHDERFTQAITLATQIAFLGFSAAFCCTTELPYGKEESPVSA